MKYTVILLLAISLFTYAQEDSEWKEAYTAFHEEKFEDTQGWKVYRAYKDTMFSECKGISLLGGRYAFGKGAAVFKNLRLPPHYQIQFKVQIWKIKTWDDELMQVYLDGYLWETKWSYSRKTDRCGSGDADWQEKIYNVELISNHNMPGLNIILTSKLDEDAENEAWGIREVTLSIRPCPGVCGVCRNNDPAQCYFYENIFMSWNRQEVALEGWELTDGNAKSNECAGINIFGGYGNIGRKSVLSKVIKNLPPHFSLLLKFQFWKIDSWDNEEFRVSVDGTRIMKQAFQFNEGVNLCGDGEHEDYSEKVVNYEILVGHNSDSAEIAMTSTLNEALENESWGIRDFYLLVGKCPSNCDRCTGPEDSDCRNCGIGHKQVNGVCEEDLSWYVLTKEFMTNDFMDYSGWTFENVFKNDVNAFSDCGDHKLVGGFSKFGKDAVAKKEYTFPPHTKVRVKVQLWKIDSWDNESIFIKFDGKQVFKLDLGFNDPGQADLCGNPEKPLWKERIINADIISEHYEEKLVVEISSTLDSDAQDESWGFREVEVLYEPKPECAEFYSECGFKGDHFEICADTPSFSAMKINQEVKSIKIPRNMAIRGYPDEQFSGGEVRFTESQECIEEFKFSFAQLHSSMIDGRMSLSGNMRRKSLMD